MSTLFISDLHLSNERPDIIEIFIAFLENRASQAEALYILGDFFEAWIGDDFIETEVKPIITSLKRLTDGGLPIYVMRGNRDFLLGQDFKQQTGCQLISDPFCISLYGTETLLMHGDTLCTDDKDYLQIRKQFHNKEWQQEFLSRPIEERLEFARHARAESKKETSKKNNAVMDVNHRTVTETFQQHKVSRIIHGHTHRQNIHHQLVDGSQCTRIVLGDWYTSGNVLICDTLGCRFESLN